MMNQNVFIIGAGVIGRAHAAAAAKLREQTKIVVTDPNPASIRQFKAEHPDAHVVDSIAAMLSHPPDLNDIVIIATPPYTHAELSAAALRSGRHVLCEKPLAMNVEEANRMLSAATSAGKLLGCCSTRFLGLPALDEVRRLVDNQILGDVYHVTFIHRCSRRRSGIEYQPESRWFLDASRSGGGVLMDWGPYDIAALVDLFRPIRVGVSGAWIARPITETDPADVVLETEQHVAATLKLELSDGRKIPVTYERAVCTHGHETSVVEVEGTLGAARWDWLGNEGQVSHAFDVKGNVQSLESLHPEQSGLSPHDRPLHHFRNAIRGQPSAALINEAALFNFSCLRGIYDAARSQKPVSIRNMQTAGGR